MIWMARLTERFSNGQAASYWCGSNCQYDHKYCRENVENCPALDAILEKLAHFEDLQEAGRLVVLPEGDGKTLFLKVLAYNDTICPSCLGLKNIPCDYATDCMDCWEAALKGGDLNE